MVESAAVVTIQWIELITPIRLTFAKYLSLALEFQLGADILSAEARGLAPVRAKASE